MRRPPYLCAKTPRIGGRQRQVSERRVEACGVYRRLGLLMHAPPEMAQMMPGHGIGGDGVRHRRGNHSPDTRRGPRRSQ
jgi:hypothetical protein